MSVSTPSPLPPSPTHRAKNKPLLKKEPGARHSLLVVAGGVGYQSTTQHIRGGNSKISSSLFHFHPHSTFFLWSTVDGWGVGRLTPCSLMGVVLCYSVTRSCKPPLPFPQLVVLNVLDGRLTSLALLLPFRLIRWILLLGMIVSLASQYPISHTAHPTIPLTRTPDVVVSGPNGYRTLYPSAIYDIRAVFDGSIINPGHEGFPTLFYTSTTFGPLGAVAGEVEGVESQSIG